jgi:hypothetical protein
MLAMTQQHWQSIRSAAEQGGLGGARLLLLLLVVVVVLYMYSTGWQCTGQLA